MPVKAPMPTQSDVTMLLNAWQSGDDKALNELIPLIYDELCIIARNYLRREGRDHTFRTRALVNEAYLRLDAHKKFSFKNRSHFFGIAAKTMRQVLVDYAREHNTIKRGGHVERIYLENMDGFSKERALDLIELDNALANLDAFDAKKCRIVELRYFAGLTIEEAAETLDMSVSTLKREWTIAKAWLKREIGKRKPS